MGRWGGVQTSSFTGLYGLIVLENIDNEGPKQPPTEAWTGLEMEVGCKCKVLITEDQKVLTANTPWPSVMWLKVPGGILCVLN